MAGPLHFDPEWRLTLLTLVLVPLMVGLGFWQLQRAGEKAELAGNWEMRVQQAPVALSGLAVDDPAALSYRRVRIAGVFEPGRYFLVDNRTRRGRFGYEVLGVLRSDSTTVLVNRGWMEGDPARRSLPRVPAVDGAVEITGHVYVAPGRPYLLAEQQLTPGWPKVIQAVEMDKISTSLDDPVFPYPVRLDPDQPGALVTDWQIVNVSPEKHRGYAVQWFTMAAVLSIFYLLRSSNLLQVLFRRNGVES
jgi:cytochrome oxidase assembly protein ShyY1